MKLEDVTKVQKILTPCNEEVAHRLRELALDLKELAEDVKILRPESVYSDAMIGSALSLFELAHDIEEGGAGIDLNQSNSTPLETHCDICGDCHEPDSIPLSCQTGDGE